MKTEDLRRLDAEVAAALGWTKHRNERPATEVEAARWDWEYHWVPPERNGDTAYWQPLPRFSSEIACAWPLAEQFGLVVGPNYSEQRPRWIATHGWQGLSEVWVEDLTAPLAICRAVLALKAKGEGE